ncbi:toprim domain-containing protein, partial [Nocardia wallacei]|uniref:toprim domain-containing protein n=1 Tax=Nocardia wallacei TaxID=480035 RepID=UPI002453E63E
TKVKCFAGCDDREVLDSLGLRVRDLYDKPITRATGGQRPVQRVRPRQVTRAERAINAAGLPLAQPKRDRGRQLSPWRQVTTYPYVRADGTIAGEVIRREADFESGRDKSFSQRAWNPQTGAWKDTGFDKIPYNLPDVLDAVAEGRTIYLVEGEKDAESARRAGEVATTNAGGALSWTPEHAAWLDGAAEIVIVADRDSAGYRRADRVLSTLTGSALRVGRIRVVQAATGKDLTDHLDAGHDLGELDPVAYLDPLTPTTAAAAAGKRGAAVPFAGQAAPGSAAGASPDQLEPTTPDLDGGIPDMGEITGLDQSAPVHDDTVDHIGSHFAQLVRLLMGQIMQMAQQAAERRRREAEQAAREDEEARREYEARFAAERKAIETRLAKMREHGWDRMSRSEIANALRDAAAWSDDSEAAKKAMNELAGHIRARFGVHVDTQTGHVTIDSPELSSQLAAVELDRATAARVRTAEDRMVSLVAAEEGIDQSKKAALYADIADWQRNPSGHSLTSLTEKLEAAGVGEKTRTKVRFVALYLGTPGEHEVPISELGATAAASPVNELRKLGEPLVDPGEEVKPRVDALLTRYQDRLRHGVDTESVNEQLAQAVPLMTGEDQELVRARWKQIRKDPAVEHKPLWPDHVDRDELAEKVRMYAASAPVVEARAARDDGVPAEWDAAQRDRVAKLRRDIDKALKSGEGLHEWEKDQLKACLADIEAGKTTVPEMLFADDRTGAALDQERADEIARGYADGHRRELEEVLDTASVPRDASRAARAEFSAVALAQTSLAAGRTSLSDYEETGVDAQLLAKLSAAGVPEPLRNRLRKELDRTASDSAITGKQAHRIQGKWTDRRELVAAGRTPAKPVSYDSAERRAATRSGLQAAGLNGKQVAGRMAVDAGHARPAQTAVGKKPGKQAKARNTRSGSGIHQAYKRGRGDQRGYGK